VPVSGWSGGGKRTRSGKGVFKGAARGGYKKKVWGKRSAFPSSKTSTTAPWMAKRATSTATAEDTKTVTKQKASKGGYKLVIVESPAKARTIQKFLDNKFVVESCMGHVRDLPQKARDVPLELKPTYGKLLGVDPDNGFAALYVIMNGKEAVIKRLKDRLKGAAELILASDEDREGEAISWHLLELLKPKVPVKRAVFHEITREVTNQPLRARRVALYACTRAPTCAQPSTLNPQPSTLNPYYPRARTHPHARAPTRRARASSTLCMHTRPTHPTRARHILRDFVKADFSVCVRAHTHAYTQAIIRAFEAPRELNYNLVHAQEARRILDRLAGYTMSPLLWRKISPGLSAGRVQSVGLAMIVRRERERLAFKSAEYYDLKANLSTCLGGKAPEARGVTSGGAGAGSSTSTRLTAMLVEVQGRLVASGRDFDSEGQLKQSNSSRAGKTEWLRKEDVEALRARLEMPGTEWRVTRVESKLQRRKPPVPFITSTLQQEANRKLAMSSKECMRVAQSLYEVRV
jgi:DNA topoisomerase IA